MKGTAKTRFSVRLVKPPGIIRLIALLILILAAGRSPAAEVMVFAAASLSEALKEIAGGYQKLSGDKIAFNLGASSALARQIELGAPADLFFSADEAKMDAVDKLGLIRKETRKSLLSNTLVIVVAADGGPSISSPRDLAAPRIKRVALAETKTVPAGVYAKEFLQKQNLWSAVESKVIATENVRGALAVVESGNVDAGIVYKTDASISRMVKMAYEVPAKEGPVISYPVAMIKDAKQPKAAGDFLTYLGGDQAARTFEKHGFITRK